MYRSSLLAVVVIASICMSACDVPPSTADQQQNRQQEQLTRQSINEIGLPAITNFQEKRTLKQILELRDSKVSTVTYFLDMNGKQHKLCDSIGYGIPYATQYTSPMRPARASETFEQGNVTLPQADPNGLFSPADAEGTWILCYFDEVKQTAPVYAEPRIIVSPYPLHIQ